MIKRVLSVLLLLCLCGCSGCVQFKSIDKSDDPRYVEVVGRVYRLKSDFRVHGHVMDGGRGATAYSYSMHPVDRPTFGNRYSLVWGIAPAGTLIKIVGVKEQPPYFKIGYLAEIVGAKDERFEGIRMAIGSIGKPSVYVKAEKPDGVMQLNERWFEEIFEATE